jgi:hypothetical protein
MRFEQPHEDRGQVLTVDGILDLGRDARGIGLVAL